MIRRPLVHQVLEQVSHAGFAIILVTRAYEISDVDGDGLLRLIGEQENSQAVGKLIFGKALNRSDSLDSLGKSRLLRLRRNCCLRYARQARNCQHESEERTKL